MSDPVRWLESKNASPSALRLLQGAEAPRALDRAIRARSRRRVHALGAVPAAAGVFLALQYVALGALLGSGAMALVSAPSWFRASDAVVLKASPRRPGSTSARVGSAVAPSALLSSSPPTASAGGVKSAPTKIKTRVELPSVELQQGAASVDLVREAKLLERARELLQSDPEQALIVLANHEREFGQGSLGLERQFLSVAALSRLGRRTEAGERANRLRSLAPGSLYEQRLQGLLEGKPSTAPAAR